MLRRCDTSQVTEISGAIDVVICRCCLNPVWILEKARLSFKINSTRQSRSVYFCWMRLSAPIFARSKVDWLSFTFISISFLRTVESDTTGIKRASGNADCGR